MRPLSEEDAWFLQEIAVLALSGPIQAIEVIGPPARYLDTAYLRTACDLLEMAARRLREGTFDLDAFSCVVDDAARHVRLSRRTVETVRQAPSARARPLALDMATALSVT